MLALIRVPTTMAYEFGNPEDGSDIVQIPDLNIPQARTWTASRTDHGVVVLHIQRPNDEVTMLLSGPYVINSTVHYLTDCPRRMLQNLKDWLGVSADAVPLLRALQNRRPVRQFFHGLGVPKRRRKSNNDIINVYAPLVLCGHGSYDNDEEPDEELMPALSHMGG